MHLLEEDGDDPVTVMMNCAGGGWHDALAIYDCIRAFPAPVIIEVFGKCMSAGVAIVQACESRLIHPNALVMVHDGTQCAEGDVRTFQRWGHQAGLERKRMYALLSSRSPKKASFWKQKCSNGDFILDPLKACQLGLFDGIVTLD